MNLWHKIKTSLTTTRQGLTQKIETLFKDRGKINQGLLEELEEILIMADLGVSCTQKIIGELRERIKADAVKDPEEVKGFIKTLIAQILEKNEVGVPRHWKQPHVIMVIGVNGVGKTTTIGKLAWRFKKEREKVLLAAGDTFRAAAIDQLEMWARKIGVDSIKHQPGADPSAVIFDALQSAKARDYDIIIADTAGRQHTNVNLMEELKKMKRVMKKVIPEAPHEILLVLDANTGQNALSQTNLFHQSLGVTGIVLTKLDGSAKGGIIVNIADTFDIPINYIGLGEELDDLQEFEPSLFASALLTD